ncbi:hypothetical protein MYU51_013551 [Penicillium brevicompactum]
MVAMSDSEASLAFYEHLGVENLVQSIIAELCKIPAARQEFHLGDGLAFKDHGNALDSVKGEESVITGPCRPDQYCIHRINEGTGTLLTTVEYKPPHKLSVASLRIGLREMDFWDEVVRPNFVPTEETEKLRYNATRLTGSALAQEYHIMIQEGLEYSYLTVGLALVLLRVRADDPETLYYQLCEPATDIEVNGDRSFEQPISAIARVLCLCLMSFKSQVRDQKWRQDVGPRLQTWETSFSHERSRIPGEELQKDPPDSPFNSSFSDSRGQQHGSSHNGSSSSYPFTQKATSQKNTSGPQSSATQRANTPFCTQRYLLGLQKGGLLDDQCPNVSLHRQGGESSHHPISAEELVKQIRQQLEDDIDDCTPMGECGSYGAPFKITSALWGYTIVGKGTTTRLWGEVSREADVYRILARLQGSAVTVFLGPIDLAKMYFLHGAGPIKHMLLMGWGGEPIKEVDPLRREYSRSINEILALGVVHQDLRPANLLWNAELGRVLIIDFHRCQLDPRPDRKRKREKKHSRGRRRTREGEQPGVIS